MSNADTLAICFYGTPKYKENTTQDAVRMCNTLYSRFDTKIFFGKHCDNKFVSLVDVATQKTTFELDNCFVFSRVIGVDINEYMLCNSLMTSYVIDYKTLYYSLGKFVKSHGTFIDPKIICSNSVNFNLLANFYFSNYYDKNSLDQSNFYNYCKSLNLNTNISFNNGLFGQE